MTPQAAAPRSPPIRTWGRRHDRHAPHRFDHRRPASSPRPGRPPRSRCEDPRSRTTQPIVVKPNGELIAGERRLRAAELLGWKEIPVNIVDLDAAVRGEYIENTCRKDFTPSEAVAIKRELESLERAAAKERQLAGKGEGGSGGRGKKKPAGNLPQGLQGRAADKAAKATRLARRTLEKAEAIVDAAEAEPERFGNLLADMDATGRVNGAFRRLMVARQAALIRAEPPPLPTRGPYRVVVLDPPWTYEPGRDARRSAQRARIRP